MTKHRATARRAVWVVTLLLTSVEVTPALGQRDLVYGENFDAGQARGWILEPGWSIEYGALVGRGHSWARYGGAVWGEGRFNLRFELAELTGGLHANIHFTEHAGRYFVGFRAARGTLSEIYLKKQVWAGGFTDLANVMLPPRIAPELPLTISISSDDAGVIEVAIGDRRALHFVDWNPLPQGTIAFETLEDSLARIDDVTAVGPRIAEPPPPPQPARAVPNVIGMMPATAGRTYRLEIEVVRQRHDPAERGTIVQQEPEPGARMPPDRIVRVVVSAGPTQPGPEPRPPQPPPGDGDGPGGLPGIVGAVILAALLVVGRRIWRSRRPTGAVRVEGHANWESQGIQVEARAPALPAIAMRIRRDPGTQEIETTEPHEGR